MGHTAPRTSEHRTGNGDIGPHSESRKKGCRRTTGAGISVSRAVNGVEWNARTRFAKTTDHTRICMRPSPHGALIFVDRGNDLRRRIGLAGEPS
jgi:hypothetical protein